MEICAESDFADFTRYSERASADNLELDTAHAWFFLQERFRLMDDLSKVQNLEAAMRYSSKKIAKLHHLRWSEGFCRLSCVEHLPISRRFRSRVILGGIFAHCLHGIEAEAVTEKLVPTPSENCACSAKLRCR